MQRVASVMVVLLQGVLIAQTQVYTKLPVREATVFKDGHVFLVHEGNATTDPSGSVILEDLPNPILGTFWAHCAEPDTAIEAVISSRDTIDLSRPVSGLLELFRANLGRRVLIREREGAEAYEAIIVQVLARDNTRHGDPPLTDNAYNESIVLLKTALGVRAIRLFQIMNLIFCDEPNQVVHSTQTKDSLRIRLGWKGRSRPKTANVGISYVQRGIRWIPNYKLQIDGSGKAKMELQAALINELVDLDGVTVHLVVGVPRFLFEDQPDPVSFQQTVARLASLVSPDSRTAYSFSNAIMTQVVAPPVERVQRGLQAPTIYLGPDVNDAASQEDLFVFTVKNVRMRKGQRLVLPLARFELHYTEVYRLDIPFLPPLEMRHRYSAQQQLELARSLHNPKVMHRLRLANSSTCPFTTAPILILKDGRVLAQSMIRYTPVGASCDVDLAPAIGIQVQVNDYQSEVRPNAIKMNGRDFARADMTGSIRLTNLGKAAVKIDVCRAILGNPDRADSDGVVIQLGPADWLTVNEFPQWWHWQPWPWWWYNINSTGKIQWLVEVGPGQTVSLGYTWHYFWLP